MVFARRVDKPLFNCAAIMGDRTLVIQEGVIESFAMNTRFPEPISIMSHDSIGERFITGGTPSFVDTTIKLRVPFGKVIYELTKEQRIRNKRVADCTIDELLFAIQKRLERKI